MTQTALTLSEAAAACGVSRSTVKRKLSEFHNAYQDGNGVWKVPVADLLAAGLKLRARPAETATQGHDPAVNGADQGQVSRIGQLEAELTAERERRLVAETEVRLLTANLEDLRMAVKAISGPVRAPEPVPVSEPAPGTQEKVSTTEAAPEPLRRGFWAWLRGV